MKKRIAIYAGSFDPVTKGHVDLIRKTCRLFDEVIVVIAKNIKKSGLFTPEERRILLHKSLQEGKINAAKVCVEILEPGNLLVKYATEKKALVLIRSMRTVTDFEEELMIAYHNAEQEPEIETILIPPRQAFEKISSSAAREIASYGGKLDYMVFPSVKKTLREKFKKS